VASDAREAQRGFVAGRNFLVNVIEEDSLARVIAKSDAGIEASLGCFDFGAAFPSVARYFLMISIEAAGAPRGFLLYVQALEQCRILPG
jgi:hypothetical protein